MIIFDHEFFEGKLKTKFFTLDEVKKLPNEKYMIQDLSFMDDPEYLRKLDYRERINGLN